MTNAAVQAASTSITIFTDCADIALNEIVASLKKELQDLDAADRVVIDLPVVVSNFSIANAAFCLRLMSDYCAPGSVLLAIVNATATDPARILGATLGGVRFVGNNSGYFGWLLRDKGVAALFRNRIDRGVDGRSFGGKYVQVPTAARIAAGTAAVELGTPMAPDELVYVSLAEGEVVHIDNFGLVKLYSAVPLSVEEGRRYQLFVNGTPRGQAVGTQSMKRWPDGTVCLYRGSSLGGLPELACVRRAHSAAELELRLGDIVRWQALE